MLSKILDIGRVRLLVTVLIPDPSFCFGRTKYKRKLVKSKLEVSDDKF